MLLFHLLFHPLLRPLIRRLIRLVKQYPCGVVILVFSFAVFSPKLPGICGFDFWPWAGVALFTVGACFADSRRKKVQIAPP
jgi:hypothetical protein